MNPSLVRFHLQQLSEPLPGAAAVEERNAAVSYRVVPRPCPMVSPQGS